MSHGTRTDRSVAKDPAGGQPPGTPENRSVAEETGRRTEPALRLALEAGEIGVWEWEISTGEVRWSENLEQIHGIPPGSFGRTFEAYRALIHPDDRERVMNAIRGCLEGRVDYEIEFRYADDARGVRWMLGKGKVLVGDGGQPFRVVGVCMEITKRKQAEQAVVDANRRKDEFLAMVSHELRNPLSVIVNAATLLGHLTKADPTASQATAAINRQTDQLVRIVDDLLDVSRLSSGKMTLERTSIDLVALVHRCINELRRTAAARPAPLRAALLRGAREWGRPAAPAGRLQSVDERDQVHAVGREDHRGAGAGGGRGGAAGQGLGRGDRSRPLAARLRSVRAERSGARTARGRAGRGPLDRAEPGRGARRAHRGAQRGSGEGERVHRAAAAGGVADRRGRPAPRRSPAGGS